MKTSRYFNLLVVLLAVVSEGCVHKEVGTVSPDQAARIDRKLVREVVTFGPGANEGAVIPDLSSPCLHADVVPEHKEDGGRVLVEKHRRWHLQCDAQILGIPARGK